MLKLKEKSLNSSTRTPHETHKRILAYLSAGVSKRRNVRGYSVTANALSSSFSMNLLVSIAIPRLLSRMRLMV